MKRLSNYYEMYSLNLHFNKIFKGNAETVKDPFLSLREAYKGMLTVSFSVTRKHYFIKKNIIIFAFILALLFADSSKPPDVFGGTNAIVALVLSGALTIKVDEEITINVRSSVTFYIERLKMKLE